MASTIIQNCQRGTIFMIFLNILLILITVISKLIRKKLDPIQEDQSQNQKKYKEGQTNQEVAARKAKHQQSAVHFDDIAVKQTVISEEDPPFQKIVKRTYDFEMLLFPILIVFPLNLVTGTSKAFQMVNYFFIMICVVIFNVTKVHRKCVQNKCIRAILQNFWLFLVFFMILNIWTTVPTQQPYIVK